jgi:predicted Zn-dependent protease
VKLVADDKLLYVRHRPLTPPEGPLGTPPTSGFAQYAGQRAVVTTANFPKELFEETTEDEEREPFRKRLAKLAVREIGRTWGLHTCLDAKCSMHPSWSAAYETNVEPVLCNFCREKSEEAIRLANT